MSTGGIMFSPGYCCECRPCAAATQTGTWTITVAGVANSDPAGSCEDCADLNGAYEFDLATMELVAVSKTQCYLFSALDPVAICTEPEYSIYPILQIKYDQDEDRWAFIFAFTVLLYEEGVNAWVGYEETEYFNKLKVWRRVVTEATTAQDCQSAQTMTPLDIGQLCEFDEATCTAAWAE